MSNNAANWWESAPESKDPMLGTAPKSGAPDAAGEPDSTWWKEAKVSDGTSGPEFDMAVAGSQFSAGVAESAGGVAAGLKGAALAGSIPTPHPAINATLALAGGVTGFFGGATLVNEILEYFGVDDPEDLPPEHRAAAYSARSLGGALPVAGAPLVAARQGVVLADKGVGKLANQIIQTAKTSPKTFAALETSSALTAAGAAGLAEVVAPGETGKRVAAEIAGGILAPGNLTTSAYRSTKRGLTKLWGRVS